MEALPKMKIGLVVDTFYPMVDGVVLVVDNYAKALSRYAEVTVFCPGGKRAREIPHPYRTVYCKEVRYPGFDYPLPAPRFDGEFRKALREARLDCIHIHSPFMIGKLATRIAREEGIPLVATIHSQYYRDICKATHSKLLSRFLLKRHIVSVFNQCDICFAVNKSIQDLAANEYGVTAPVTVANNGTDLTLIENYDEARLACRRKYGIGEEERVLLFVGRLNKIKNIFFLTDAFKLLCEREEGYRLLFVGVGQDEEALRKRIHAEGLDQRVLMVGKLTSREEMKAIYATADLFTFPSLYDASSLVQIEAASQRTPTLFLRTARTAATVTDGVNGFLSDETPSAYAEKIREIFSDPARLHAISDAAHRDLAVSWEKTVCASFDQYRRLAREKNEKIFFSPEIYETQDSL